MLRIFNDVSLNFSISNNITEDFEHLRKIKHIYKILTKIGIF